MELGPTPSDVQQYLIWKILDLKREYKFSHIEDLNYIKIIVGRKEPVSKDKLFGMEIDYEISNSRM